MNQIYVAYYHGNRDKSDGVGFYYRARLSDGLIRFFTKGPYSHCELAVSLGEGKYRCYSASIRDKGVRIKDMALPENKWTLIPIEELKGYDPEVHTPESIEAYFQAHLGQPYDFSGALGVVFPNSHRGDKWFCSEIVADYFGLYQSWRYSPNMLYAVMKQPARGS